MPKSQPSQHTSALQNIALLDLCNMQEIVQDILGAI
jgi:hypothetical protein